MKGSAKVSSCFTGLPTVRSLMMVLSFKVEDPLLLYSCIINAVVL